MAIPHSSFDLSLFISRVCYALWHGAPLLASSSHLLPNASVTPTPRFLYHTTPTSFTSLVRRTLHPAFPQYLGLVALLYVQRYIHILYAITPSPTSSGGNPAFSRPGPGSEARVWTTALYIALKMHDDRAAAARCWPLARLDEVAGGMTARELATMEREFLEGIGWKVVVTAEYFQGWMEKLRLFRDVMEERGGSGKASRRNGWNEVGQREEVTRKRTVDDDNNDEKEKGEETTVKPRARKRSVTPKEGHMMRCDVYAEANADVAEWVRMDEKQVKEIEEENVDEETKESTWLRSRVKVTDAGVDQGVVVLPLTPNSGY